VTSQTAHNKYKWLPYATEWTPHENFLRTPLAKRDRVKVVMIAGWSSSGFHRIFKTFHQCFVNIYRYGFYR